MATFRAACYTTQECVCVCLCAAPVLGALSKHDGVFILLCCLFSTPTHLLLSPAVSCHPPPRPHPPPTPHRPLGCTLTPTPRQPPLPTSSSARSSSRPGSACARTPAPASLRHLSGGCGGGGEGRVSLLGQQLASGLDTVICDYAMHSSSTISQVCCNRVSPTPGLQLLAACCGPALTHCTGMA